MRTDWRLLPSKRKVPTRLNVLYWDVTYKYINLLIDCTQYYLCKFRINLFAMIGWQEGAVEFMSSQRRSVGLRDPFRKRAVEQKGCQGHRPSSEIEASDGEVIHASTLFLSSPGVFPPLLYISLFYLSFHFFFYPLIRGGHVPFCHSI